MSTFVEKFHLNEFETLWSSIKDDGGISAGTLFHHARENGWTDPRLMDVYDTKDIRNAKLFAEANRGALLFIIETGDVLSFGEAGWVKSSELVSVSGAKAVIKDMRIEASELFKQSHDNPKAIELNKHADYSSTAQRIQAMIELAKSEDGMSARLSAFDSDSNLLGLLNGVLNLKQRSLMPVNPSLLVSMRANVHFDPQAKCTLWKNFISEIQPDPEMQALMQQLSGIFLCGDSNLQKIIFLYGHGANGKSTFIEVLAWLLGDYTRRIATEMLMHHQRNPQGPSPDIVGLKGRRLVYCNEIEEGRHLAEARVKELTGGDTLSGRTPYAKEEVSFQPTHSLVMVGNHQPEIHDMSHGMWRRMLMVRFDQIIPDAKRDADLVNKLKAEASGILNWALDGYQSYKKSGLLIPSAVTKAIDVYKDEQDLIGEWINDHCVLNASAKTSKHDCYKAYQYWAKQRGQYPLAQGRFTTRLRDRGYSQDAGKRNLTGLELNQQGRVSLTKGF